LPPKFLHGTIAMGWEMTMVSASAHAQQESVVQEERKK